MIVCQQDKKNARDEALEKKKKAQQLANESLLKQVVVPTKDYHDSSSDSEVDVKKHSTSVRQCYIFYFVCY